MTEVLEHHGARPDLADRVGDPLAGDVGGAAVHRLEHRGEGALGVDVAAGRDGDRAGGGRPEVGEDVAEQVGADDHVEPVRVAHEMGGQDVDVELAGLDLGILLGDRREALVPVGHGDGDAVRLGGGDDLATIARHGEVEGIAHDALAALLGEDGGLDRPFELGALVHAPADGGILALVVLAHDEVVDVAGLAVGEGRFEAVEEAYGAEVDVLLEAAADRNQQAPQRDVIGHSRPPHSTKVDRVMLGDLVEPVGRHHGAGLGKALARPVQVVPGVVDAEAGAHRLQHADPLRHHLVADAITGDDGDRSLLVLFVPGTACNPPPA